jgi:hypothetical protein
LHQREARRFLWQMFFGRALLAGKARKSGLKTARPAGIGGETSSRQTALSAACKTPGHVLPGFTLASQPLAEVEQLLPRAAEG